MPSVPLIPLRPLLAGHDLECVAIEGWRAGLTTAEIAEYISAEFYCRPVSEAEVHNALIRARDAERAA